MTITEYNVFVSDKKGCIEDGHKSFGHLLIDRLDRNPEKVVYIDYASGREWTAAKLKDKILNIATCLIRDYGLQQGTVVCISYNWSDWSNILAISIICAGGTVCCHYPKDPYNELLRLAKKVEFKLLFCHGCNLDWVKKLELDMGYSVTGVEMDGKTDSKASLQYLLNFQEEDGQYLVPIPCKDLKQDVAIIMMSSGTTGKPKAIPYTHHNGIADFVLGRDDDIDLVSACVAPIDYVSGRLITLNCIINRGLKGIIIDGYEPETLLRAVEKYRIQGLGIGVASFCNLIAHEKIDQFDISSLVMVCATGAKFTYKTELKKFIAKHPHIWFWVQTYGTSEISTVSHKALNSQQMLSDSNNCGQLKAGVRIRVVDIETGENLGFNQSGSVRVYSETCFPGYMDKEQMRATNSSELFVRDATIFDELGYYITGDIGYFSEGGELFIEGREKELLVCRGQKKVLPQELEDVLSEHPAVLIACVFGVKQKDNPNIECPRAFIKLKQDYYDREDIKTLSNDTNEPSNGYEPQRQAVKGSSKLCSLPVKIRHQVCEDIMAFLKDKLSWKKQLTGGLVIIDEMKFLVSSGKVDKMYLRSLSLEDVEIYGDQSC